MKSSTDGGSSGIPTAHTSPPLTASLGGPRGAIGPGSGGSRLRGMVLDLHANPEAKGSRFENPLWWKHMSSLKPIGRCCFLFLSMLLLLSYYNHLNDDEHTNTFSALPTLSIHTPLAFHLLLLPSLHPYSPTSRSQCPPHILPYHTRHQPHPYSRGQGFPSG